MPAMAFDNEFVSYTDGPGCGCERAAVPGPAELPGMLPRAALPGRAEPPGMPVGLGNDVAEFRNDAAGADGAPIFGPY